MIYYFVVNTFLFPLCRPDPVTPYNCATGARIGRYLVVFITYKMIT